MKSIRNFLVNSNHDWSGEFESPELKLSDESIRKTKWRGGGARFKHSQLSATTRSWSAVKVFTANFDFIVKSWTDSVVLFSTQILFGSGILKWIRVQWSDYLIFVVETANFDKMKFLNFDFVYVGLIVISQTSQLQSSSTSSLLRAVNVLTWNLAFTLKSCTDSVVLFSKNLALISCNMSAARYEARAYPNNLRTQSFFWYSVCWNGIASFKNNYSVVWTLQ